MMPVMQLRFSIDTCNEYINTNIISFGSSQSISIMKNKKYHTIQGRIQDLWLGGA